jgi:hypothetical protein
MHSTFEEKAAKKILNLLSDFSIDAGMIGMHLARITPYALFGRVKEMMQYASHEYDRIEQEKTLREEYKNGNTLF